MRVLSRGGGEEGADINKKYGYYLISPDIFNLVSEGKEGFYQALLELSLLASYIELNGRTYFDRISVPIGYINIPIAQIVLFMMLNANDLLLYCNRNYFNLGMKVDESDMNFSICSENGVKKDTLYKGTLLERFELIGAELIPYFIPITNVSIFAQ